MAGERCAACGQRIAAGGGPAICELCGPGYNYALQVATATVGKYVSGAPGREIANQLCDELRAIPRVPVDED